MTIKSFATAGMEIGNLAIESNDFILFGDVLSRLQGGQLECLVQWDDVGLIAGFGRVAQWYIHSSWFWPEVRCIFAFASVTSRDVRVCYLECVFAWDMPKTRELLMQMRGSLKSLTRILLYCHVRALCT